MYYLMFITCRCTFIVLYFCKVCCHIHAKFRQDKYICYMHSSVVNDRGKELPQFQTTKMDASCANSFTSALQSVGHLPNPAP